MTAVATHATSFAHVVTYFSDKMLMTLGTIISGSGLSMTKFLSSRGSMELAIKTWLQSGHLRKVTLEIFKPGTTTLIRRWDLDWDKCDVTEAMFWVDVEDIRYHMRKLGVLASECSYRFVIDAAIGRPSVPGWYDGNYADASGLKQFSLGTIISAGGHGSRASYWR